MQSPHDRVRLANMLSLLCWSKVSKGEFAARIGMRQTYLSLLIHGHRNIGPRLALRIERAFDKPAGWLDVDRSASAEEEEFRVLFGQLPRDLQDDAMRLIHHLHTIAQHRQEGGGADHGPEDIAGRGIIG